ncbi:MAG: hypothetical protein M1434_07170 [Chloroflexi bacterium]|nr:hypothetical protein [Chloroflexota bacterium]MCL5274512.1 hypothetical protein [Chloroflexota bacterium]
MTSTPPQLVLSPHGRLYFNDAISDDSLCAAFAEGSAQGLIALAACRGADSALAAELAFWREFAQAYLSELARTPQDEGAQTLPGMPMPPALGADFTLRIPAMRGAEYATPDVFGALWDELHAYARVETQRAGGLRTWLTQINPALHLLGKVTFHLAENRRTPETPFAFMATYTHRLSAQEKPVHLPLARALQEAATRAARRPQDRNDVLGQSMVRQPRSLQ